MIQGNDEYRDLRLLNKLQMQREILYTRLFLLFYTFKPDQTSSSHIKSLFRPKWLRF